MGQTIKRNYDRYTLEFKLQTVKLANNPNVKAKDIAESLGIHPIMLYRWRMEHKNGELKANKNMKTKKLSPKRLPNQIDPLKAKDDELRKAEKKIKQLERALENRTEELDLLKKAERFLAQRAKK
jgi:transposase